MSLTWKCHSCGDTRDDADINVLSFPILDLPGAERNWRYCNDRPRCYDIAITKSRTGAV